MVIEIVLLKLGLDDVQQRPVLKTQFQYLNVLKLLRALNRPFGQGGLPVSGVDAQIGTASQEIQFGTSYETRASNMGYDIVQYGVTQAELDELQSIISELGVKGYNVTGLEDI